MAGACMFGLAGCGNLNIAGEPEPIRQAALLGGAVGVAGPAGYCVNLKDSRLTRGFAMLAPCGTLGQKDAELPRFPGIVTVQAGRLGSAAVAGSEPALAGFLQTAAGAALLSEGTTGVNVLGTSLGTNKVTVQFQNTGGSPMVGTQDMAWRAFVDIDGRLVTISVRGLTAQPLGTLDGAQLLDAAIAAVIAVNAIES